MKCYNSPCSSTINNTLFDDFKGIFFCTNQTSSTKICSHFPSEHPNYRTEPVFYQPLPDDNKYDSQGQGEIDSSNSGAISKNSDSKNSLQFSTIKQQQPSSAISQPSPPPSSYSHIQTEKAAWKTANFIIWLSLILQLGTTVSYSISFFGDNYLKHTSWRVLSWFSATSMCVQLIGLIIVYISCKVDNASSDLFFAMGLTNNNYTSLEMSSESRGIYIYRGVLSLIAFFSGIDSSAKTSFPPPPSSPPLYLTNFKFHVNCSWTLALVALILLGVSFFGLFLAGKLNPLEHEYGLGDYLRFKDDEEDFYYRSANRRMIYHSNYRNDDYSYDANYQDNGTIYDGNVPNNYAIENSNYGALDSGDDNYSDEDSREYFQYIKRCQIEHMIEESLRKAGLGSNSS